MRTSAHWKIGASLILVVACGQEYPGPHVPAGFHETIVDGRLRFKLLSPEATWKAMTAHSLGIPSALLDD